LLEHASGSLSEGESLLVASHAALCSACRRTIREIEAMAGAMLESAAPSSIPPSLLEATMAKLGTQEKPARKAPSSDALLPRPLVRYTGPFDAIAWKKAFKSVWYVDLPVSVGSVPVRLRRFDGGVRIPMHTHQGAELELVLSGGATDDRDGRKYERGDVAFSDESDVHSVTIERDEPCIALGVHVARLKPVGLWSRLIFNYLGW
jgi:putative transcriptional regulator